MNNDRDMITTLVENGAILDYRLSKKDGWKTPLHVAAQSNKIGALQALIQFGAWVNAPDALNLTPLYYAVVGGHHDCTLRLLAARADTEVYDESGKGPMHQAVFQNNEVIASLLIDYGANLNVGNAVGNTPLHVAATRNAKECARWLIMRGCEREKTNKSGQTASQLASMSGNVDIAEMIRKFTDDQIIPPPPRPSPEEINLGGFATGTITRQNTMRGHISDLDRGHLSFSSMDGSMPRSTSVSSITSSSLSGKRDSVVTLGGTRKRTTRMNMKDLRIAQMHRVLVLTWNHDPQVPKLLQSHRTWPTRQLSKVTRRQKEIAKCLKKKAPRVHKCGQRKLRNP
ncbi:ankyrin repeat-containing domain protein [Gaertneriomyces semiglobifer]|nr:ankyrin repeat-containing domain protein [Gaertneriomyces semiglobifer]